MKDANSLSHSKWRCQYHIVFASKYRRREIYGKLKVDIGQILRKLCEQNNYLFALHKILLYFLCKTASLTNGKSSLQ